MTLTVPYINLPGMNYKHWQKILKHNKKCMTNIV